MKFRPIFFGLSLILLISSFYSIIRFGFVQGIDFVGGSVWEFRSNLPASDIENIFKDNAIGISSQVSKDRQFLIKFDNITTETKTKLQDQIKKSDQNFTELRFETLGPSLGRELINKTITAVVLASIMLLYFIGSRFNDWTFGLGAILAMFHDTFILIGSFSILGRLFGAQLDSLFVTALLTTLSSSVHDTVVTFDRMRELRRRNFNSDWVALANQAVSEVIVRSINNSMTIIFMLLALVVLGGDSTRWFAVALLIGVVCGTYSSTGVAIPLVLYFKSLKKSRK